MVPNASDLARRRLTALAVVRAMALIAWGITSIPVIGILAIIAASGGRDMEPMIAMCIIAIAGGGIGAAFWFAAPALARWMLPTPRAHACPRCSYDLRSITEPRCPECGTVLTEEFIPDHVAPGPTATPLGTLRTAQLTGLLVGRLLGVLAGLGFGAALLAGSMQLLFPRDWWDEEDYFAAILWTGYSALGLALCAFPVLLPGRFTRWLVPVRLLPMLTELGPPPFQPPPPAQAPVPPSPP